MHLQRKHKNKRIVTKSGMQSSFRFSKNSIKVDEATDNLIDSFIALQGH